MWPGGRAATVYACRRCRPGMESVTARVAPRMGRRLLTEPIPPPSRSSAWICRARGPPPLLGGDRARAPTCLAGEGGSVLTFDFRAACRPRRVRLRGWHAGAIAPPPRCPGARSCGGRTWTAAGSSWLVPGSWPGREPTSPQRSRCGWDAPVLQPPPLASPEPATIGWCARGGPRGFRAQCRPVRDLLPEFGSWFNCRVLAVAGMTPEASPPSRTTRSGCGCRNAHDVDSMAKQFNITMMMSSLTNSAPMARSGMPPTRERPRIQTPSAPLHQCRSGSFEPVRQPSLSGPDPVGGSDPGCLIADQLERGGGSKLRRASARATGWWWCGMRRSGILAAAAGRVTCRRQCVPGISRLGARG